MAGDDGMGVWSEVGRRKSDIEAEEVREAREADGLAGQHNNNNELPVIYEYDYAC